jgi:hypothetical protein
MTHWLEEAELEKQDGPKKKQKVSRTVIQQKTEDIRQNYKVNNEAYDGFINAFFSICQRANNLPPELREPWGMIESKAKESKMDSHLYSFLSRERFDMRVPTKSFPFMKLRHFKHVRQIMFSVSKDMGMSNVEIYENYITKTRLNKEDGSEDKPDRDDGLDRFHLVYHYPIDLLDNKLALTIIDWLAFKEEIDHLPFKEDQIKRVGKTRTA